MTMGLRIQNNVEAFGAHRRLVDSSNRMAKSMERLASGFRINRGGDDAAGLGISERMRAQTRGLAQAQRNIQDGISLVQTAEGNLNEVHAMLQRVRELAVQYKNGSLSASDRTAIQSEVNQLASEIDRIGRQASFNGIKLLDNTSTVVVPGRLGTTSSDRVAMVSLGAAVGTQYTSLSARDRRPARDRQRDQRGVAQRASLGGVQNRLEHSLQAAGAYQENLVAAESRIRDVDMAAGDGQLHEVLDPRAGRPGDARPGQPVACAGSLAAPVATAPGSSRSHDARRAALGPPAAR
jgi:flagellin